MDICQRVTRVVSPRRLGGGLVGPHLRGGRYPGDSSVPLCHVVLAGRFGDSPLPNPFLRWVGRAASPRRPLFPMGAQFCLPCRSRRAARRSAYRIHVVRWVGRAASNTSLQRHRKDGFDVIQQKLVLDRTGALVIEIESPGKEGNVVGTHFAPKCCTNSRHRTRATRCWQR